MAKVPPQYSCVQSLWDFGQTKKKKEEKKKTLDILCVCLWTEHRAFPNARKDMPKEITGWSHYDVISIFIYNTSLPTQVQRISVIGCLLL